MDYKCPNCSTKIAIVAETSGKEIPCPECGVPVRLPTVPGAPSALNAPKKTLILYGSNSPPLAALSMKQHFDDTPLLRSRSRARGERACPGEASSKKESDSAIHKVARRAAEPKTEEPLRPRPAPLRPLAEKVKERKKRAVIGKVMDELLPGPRVKPGDVSSPGDFSLKEPTEKDAARLKLQPMLARETQRRAGKEFKIYRHSEADVADPPSEPGEVAKVRIRPRSVISRFFGRARDFILFDPRLRRGPAPEDSRDSNLREQYQLKAPTAKIGVEKVAVRPIGKRKEDEKVSGFHDALENYVELHDFEEMEGFGEMSKEEQEAILSAQAEIEHQRVRSVNKRMFFSALIFAAPAVIAVTILSIHAMKKGAPAGEADGGTVSTPESRNAGIYSILDAQTLALKIDAAESVEEMAKFTRDPDATLPRMRRYYEHVAFPPNRIRDFPQGGSGEIDLPSSGFLWLIATVDDYRERMLAFEKTEDGLRLDWESYVNYSEVPWVEFIREQPSEPMEFRVTVTHDNYFANRFSDETQWQCYRLADPDNNGFCYAYLPRTSHAAGSLDGMLRAQAAEEGIKTPRASVKMILSLQFPVPSGSFGQAEIEKIVCGGWVKP